MAVVSPSARGGWVLDAVRDGGGEPAAPADADALVWFGPHDPGPLRELLDECPRIRWVHLLGAGVDRLAPAFDRDRVWTCGKGLSRRPLAEHALLLALAGLRGLAGYVRADTWRRPGGTSLYERPVTIVGGGAITAELIRHLAVFDCEVTVVRRRPDPVPGASRVLGSDRLHDALAGAQVVFLALALTPQTRGLIGAAELGCMEESAWLVNVSRGGHVVTDDLVAALGTRAIGGAALDCTDPEPLPAGHMLWACENCIITPHTATTVRMIRRALAGRVRENVALFAAGREMLGVVDVEAGY